MMKVTTNMKKEEKIMKTRKWTSLLLVLLLLLSLIGCGASAPSENYYKDSMAEMQAPAEAPASGTLNKTESSSATVMPTDRKLIRTVHISAETEDLTGLLEELSQRISQLGGYVESKELYNGSNYAGYVRRNLTMTIRIPAEKADAFISNVTEKSNIISSNESMEDVTLQYVDTESHVKALETEQERLLALLEKADNLKDILTLEEHLTSVRYQLERYASQLRGLENQVTYATIHLSVTEVKEYTPVVTEEPTAWERISQGFGKSLKNIGEGLKEFFIWFIVNSPYLVLWSAIAGLIFGLVFKGKIKLWKEMKKLKKKATPPENKE